MNKKILYFIPLIFGLIIGVYLISQTTVLSGRASSTSNRLPAKENSYLFASPIQAKGDSQEKIRITVFILDGQGLGVSQQPVTLNTPPEVSITPLQPTTDELGKATFDLSCNHPGKFQITAKTDTLDLPQKITILFL